MGWAIENGLKSKHISRTFVSTDSAEYQAVAVAQGAEVPFLRPAEIAHSTATDYQLFEHFLGWFRENEPEDAQPSLLVQLRPTAPCLTPEKVDQAIEHFLNHESDGYDSLRSITPADHEPFNMYFLDPKETDRLIPIIPTSHHKDDPSDVITEPQSVARQILPSIYWHNAYVDVIRPATVLEQKCVMGKRCLAYHMNVEDNVDIDTIDQWKTGESKKRKLLSDVVG